MIKEIKIGDRQSNLLIKILRDVLQELEEDNKEVLDRNKHRKEYLTMLNNNSFAIQDVKKILKQLE